MTRFRYVLLSIGLIAGVALGSVVITPTRLGPVDIYPPASVPGVRNPEVTQDTIATTICVPGWTSTIRPSSSYTTGLKNQEIAHYADKNPLDYEEDHLISLELGGSPTDPHNLWAEPHHASIADGGSPQKDQTENFLHTQVCAGLISLAEAQKEIATDWYAVYRSMKHPAYGSLQDVTAYVDPDDQ